VTRQATAETPAPAKPAPSTPATVGTPAPASRHFNNENGSDYVLVCLRSTSLGREAEMSAADKAKAEQYKADMVGVAKNLVADPSSVPELVGYFRQHTPVVMRIIAWDPSISKPGIDKIDIIPHQTREGQACPPDSKPPDGKHPLKVPVP
jgi:hypothetical protein